MKPKVYLGFLDERVEKHKEFLNYKTNKVGGKPDWVDNNQAPTPLCKLCGLVLPLIIQVYGPLEKSYYHRTLYLFGCINPNCWNKQESWVCLRSQVLDNTISKTVTEESKTINDFDWCDGAGVWEGEEVARSTPIDQTLVNEDELSNRISLLNCNKAFSIEAKVETLPTATAEIEDDEDEMVTIDTPMSAHTDLAALIHQVTPMPQMTAEMLEFTSSFISVIEEDLSEAHDNCYSSLTTNIPTLESNLEAFNGEVGISVDIKDSMEEYEKTVPAHGDKLFHRFISTIQKNPGQILRYIRDGGEPLFFYPAEALPQQCQHCAGDLVFELQLLPTLVSSLQLVGSAIGQIEFGTVFILACKNSCWASEDVTRSEFVYVQKELI